MLPNELLARISSSDLTEMMAFERLEPFGDLADEWRLGQIAAAVVNVTRTDEDSRVWLPTDFMPGLQRERNSIDPPKPRGLDLDPEALSALLDATLFGRASTVH